MQDTTLLNFTGKDPRRRTGTQATKYTLGARPGHGDGRGRGGLLGSPESLPHLDPAARARCRPISPGFLKGPKAQAATVTGMHRRGTRPGALSSRVLPCNRPRSATDGVAGHGRTNYDSDVTTSNHVQLLA